MYSAILGEIKEVRNLIPSGNGYVVTDLEGTVHDIAIHNLFSTKEEALLYLCHNMFERILKLEAEVQMSKIGRTLF